MKQEDYKQDGWFQDDGRVFHSLSQDPQLIKYVDLFFQLQKLIAGDKWWVRLILISLFFTGKEITASFQG